MTVKVQLLTTFLTICLWFSVTHAADTFVQHARDGHVMLKEQLGDELHDYVIKVAEQAGLSAPEARVQLEAYAVWQQLMNQSITIEISDLQYPDRSDNAVFSSISRLKKTPHWTLQQIETAIATDREFLRKQGNNADNDAYA